MIRRIGPFRLKPRGNSKIPYYARAVFQHLRPGFYLRHRLGGLLASVTDAERAELVERVAYCNRLDEPVTLPSDAPRIDEIPFKNSTYFFDLMEAARYFDPALRLGYMFGDVIEVPPAPAVVKSRPLGVDNSNGVLMKLDKTRHYYLPRDRTRFRDKVPKLVWRGAVYQPHRRVMMQALADHPLCDIGHVKGDVDGIERKAFMPVSQQLGFKYCLSVEGNDVATNLKWIMGSNSLCFTPKPTVETWFMEETLVAGKHYVEVRPDFADVEDKILYYERHADEAEDIIRNANAHVDRFRNPRMEMLISLFALQKYFEKTGQLAPNDVLDFR